MAKFIAFLRAINVGGHVVKMDHLRRLFESLGFWNVETFIASGNVLFEAKSKNVEGLEKQIEKKLKEALGYEVSTFIRTDAELKEVMNYKPFPQSEIDAATAFNIAFLKEPLDEKSTQKVMALRTGIDDFHVHISEIYWLCQKKQSESTFSNAILEKTLGKPSTIRGITTVQKIGAKLLEQLMGE
jgi:uncharacterized protein (DUF1697 family)